MATAEITCCWLPGCALRVVAHRRADLARPVALASDAEAHPVVLDCSAAAREAGVEPGMLVSRAMGCSADLVVLGCDVPRVEDAAERFVQRLEALGAAVQPLEPGRVFFDAVPLMRMYGGVAGVLERALGAFRDPDVRMGVGPNPFVAWVAARHAGPRGWLRIEASEAKAMLARMPLGLLPADGELLRLLHALGMETLGDLAALDAAHMADRFGAVGLRLHALARGEDDSRLSPRVPTEPVVEHLDFPEPVANSQTLERAVTLLAERLATSPRCVQHAPRAVVVSCTLGPGGSWRERRVLRTPTVDARRIALAIHPALAEVPSPVERITLALDGFEPRVAAQRSLLGGHGSALAGTAASGGDDDVSGLDDERVQRGMRHVQEALGDESLLQVLEVEPWSRVPERHAVLVPRRTMGEARVEDDVGLGVWH